MPWSVKAQELLREQYAAVGAAARASLTSAKALLRQAAARGIDTARPGCRLKSACARRNSTAMPMPATAGR